MGNTSQSLCPSVEEMRAVHSSLGLVSAFCASLAVTFFHHLSCNAVALSKAKLECRAEVFVQVQNGFDLSSVPQLDAALVVRIW